MTQRIVDVLDDNPAKLTVDAMLRLVEADPVAAGSLLTHDVPSEIITAILARYPKDDGLAEAARGHWNAPVAVKLSLLLWEVSGASMMYFFDAVRATEREQRTVSDAIQYAMAQHEADQATETLGQLWDRIRPLDLT